MLLPENMLFTSFFLYVRERKEKWKTKISHSIYVNQIFFPVAVFVWAYLASSYFSPFFCQKFEPLQIFTNKKENKIGFWHLIIKQANMFGKEILRTFELEVDGRSLETLQTNPRISCCAWNVRLPNFYFYL